MTGRRLYTDEQIIQVAVETAQRLGKEPSQLVQEDWPVATVSLHAAVDRFGWSVLKRKATEQVQAEIRHRVEGGTR